MDSASRRRAHSRPLHPTHPLARPVMLPRPQVASTSADLQPDERDPEVRRAAALSIVLYRPFSSTI